MPRDRNNFLLFRLIFSSLVLLSHAPEIADGNRHRELLTRLFGTISFGEFAVDGFFLISGFLITQSWEHRTNFSDYLQKRFMRIAPAYVAAFILSIVIIGLLASPNPKNYFTIMRSSTGILANLNQILTLGNPLTPPVFAGQCCQTVNGSMWTLHYEFACYLFIAICGTLGLIKKNIVIVTAFSLIAAYIFMRNDAGTLPLQRFAMFFCTGAMFYQCRETVLPALHNIWLLVFCGIVFFVLFHIRLLAEPALALFGGALLFAAIFAPAVEWVNRLPDFSYGLYLYGWPVEHSLIWYFPSASPWSIFAAALPIAASFGIASCFLIEKPALAMLKGSTSFCEQKEAKKLG